MLQALIGPIANLAGSWLQGKADKNAAAAELKLTEAKAKAQILLSKEQALPIGNALWQRAQNQAGKTNGLYVILSIPLILCWIPGAEGWVDRGFAQLSKAPDWYFYSLGIAISASFGVRGAQAFFKRK